MAHGEGPDISRSAAGLAGAEGSWLPTALLPRFGVRWSAPAPDQVTAAFRVGEIPLELALRLDRSGRITALQFDRWGDPAGDGRFGWHPFEGEITGYASFAGLTIPAAGRLGWGYGTDRWPQGEFFRYRITGLQPVGPARDPGPATGSR